MMIHLLTEADAPEYHRLRLQALQTDPQAFLSTWENESTKHDSDFAWELESYYHPPLFGYYGIFDQTEKQEKLIAFVQLGSSYLVKQKHVAFIYNLYIDPNHRHQGVGQQLFDHIFQAIQQHDQQIERIFLSCNALNKPAIRFYQKIGFKRCGIKPRSVKWNGVYDDEIEMVMVLK